MARRSIEQFALEPASFGRFLEIPEALRETVYNRMRAKLERDPVEDFRIDFEDGYGFRSGAEEDSHALSAAEQVARGLEADSLPPFLGIRIKPFTSELKDRGLRTLRLFLGELVEHTDGRLPANFVVTLPKITAPEQVSTLVDALDPYPDARIEMMIETPAAVLGIPALLEAARGRASGAHFGAYDYTASLGITAQAQDLSHPACDFARSMMQVSFAGTGVWLSDGATNILPVPPHRADGLSAAQFAENRAVVERAWKLHYDHVRHALHNGFYQGWDLHPAQLPTRYAAVYSFFLEGLDAASERLRNFMAQAAQATLVGDVFDDAATGQGLLNYFLRAVNCGAIPEPEVPALTGLTLDELHTASFMKILQRRRE